MKRLLFIFLVLWPALALAVQPDEKLADPALEARARAISQELRCLVCQNQSIDDSEAAMARDLRLMVRERLKSGETDAQVMQAVTDRFGNFVRLDPPVNGSTLALWLIPFAVLGLGAAVAFTQLRRKPASQPEELNDEDRQRVAEYLDAK
jgi:cytochrome c-type biogenesis protein CcmH